MYKILIKYNKSQYYTNLWMIYGEITNSSVGTATTCEFIEFKTDDIEVLKEKIKELDAIYGFGNIRVIKDVTYNITVDISETEINE